MTPKLRLFVLLACAITATRARAYTVSSLITDGCHEKITSEALRTVRLQLTTAAPIPADRNDTALINDLQFVPDPDMSDLGGATLLIGMRDNDLKGLSSTDLTVLALVQGDPTKQEEHCLRGPDDKEPMGSESAVAACRKFILTRFQEALAGLDANGVPDPNNRIVLPVHLSLRGNTDALLPLFYVRMGQALHAVEDSFAHTYRTPDGMQITVVLDWLDEVNGSLDESIDGPPHSGEMDRCDDPDALRTLRRQLATQAATSMLHAALDPSLSDAEKMQTAQDLLDQYLTYVPGCDASNKWCNAVELGNVPLISCSSTGTQSRAWLGWLTAMLFAAWQLRPRRKRTLAKASLFLGAALALALPARQAWADGALADGGAPSSASMPADAGVTDAQKSADDAAKDAQKKMDDAAKDRADKRKQASEAREEKKDEQAQQLKTATPDKNGLPPPPTRPVPEPGPRDRSKPTLGGFFGGSGSVDNGALAVAIGARLRVSTTWTFGLDMEWNPWLAYSGSAVRPGSFNAYGSVIHRLPLVYEQFNLRTSASVGMSTLLMDLYGAEKGSVGVYVALMPLGIEYKLSRQFYLIFDPLGIAIPVPHLRGVPLSYAQYRATIGLEFYMN